MRLKELIQNGAKGLDWEADSVSWASTTLNGNLPYAPRISREYRPAWYNSTVWPCLSFAYSTFTEADLCVERPVKGSGRWEIVDDHPLTRFMSKPCGNNFTYNNMMFEWALSRFMKGDSYVVKRKNGLGRSVALFPYPHYGMKPVWDEFIWPGIWVHHYSTINRYGAQEDYRPDEVFHSRLGMDPENLRQGLSPLACIFRDVMTTEEIAIATFAMSKNPIAALVISPKDPEVTIDEPEGMDIAEMMYNKAGGEQRGRILTPSLAVDVNKVGFSPAEMVWDKIAAIPRAHICAAFNLDPLAVNLPSENGKFTSLEQARKAGVESCTLPMWRDFAADCTLWLLPEFGDFNERVNFNKRGVRMLQGDEDDLVDRAVTAYRGGIWKRSMALEATHQPFTPEDEVYITDISGGAPMADHQSTLENSRRGDPLPGTIPSNGKGKRNQMQNTGN